VTAFTPNIGGNVAIPFGAVFYNRSWEEHRLRAVVAFLVNEIAFAESFGEGAIDALVNFENSTIPFGATEIVDGDDLPFTAIKWGYNKLFLGVGRRLSVWPGNFDNTLQVQLQYQASYYYFQSVKETGKIEGVRVTDVQIPPDTYVHGIRARLRIDMLQRNLMELPHYGLAFGGDFVALRRDRWEDQGAVLPDGSRQFKERDTRDYVQFSAYAHAALPIPLLSERHRLILSAHAGWMPTNDVDRFNGFRLGGGPPVSEAGDLYRSPYPGAMFDQFVAKRYFIAAAEYRLELMFFLFLHLRATVAWGEVPTFQGVPNAPLAPVRFVNGRGESYSLAITSGFLWGSVLYLEYAYDTGSLRAGENGHMLLCSLSKEF